MSNIKQAIIFRKDIKIRRGKLASLASLASAKFIIENNEADRNDELFVKLSQEEVQWIKESSPKVILGIDTAIELTDLAFRAELLGINVYSVFDEKLTKADRNSYPICVALGPDDEELINQITNHLKSI